MYVKYWYARINKAKKRKNILKISEKGILTKLCTKIWLKANYCLPLGARSSAFRRAMVCL